MKDIGTAINRPKKRYTAETEEDCIQQKIIV